MIKKFNEYIEEGLWKSGIERSKTGIVRKEDTITIENNLFELNDVDLGDFLDFVIADKDLRLNDEPRCGVEDFMVWMDKIEKNTGWRLPKTTDLEKIKENMDNMEYTILDDEITGCITSKQTGGEFKYLGRSQQYLAQFPDGRFCFFFPKDITNPDNKKGSVGYWMAHERDEYLIRLIKDKK